MTEQPKSNRQPKSSGFQSHHDKGLSSSAEPERIDNDLLETQRQIEFILGAAKTNLDIIDIQFNIRYVDPACSKVYGAWAGRKCYDYFMGRDKPCSNCNAPAVFATKQTMVKEDFLFGASGIYTYVTSIPYQDKNGEWLVAQVSVDVSERKKAEELLAENEARFRGFFEVSSVGMIMTDLNAQFVMVNPAVCRILGYTGEELMSKTFADITYLKDESVAIAMDRIAKLLDGSIEFHDAERRYIHKDGHLIWVYLNTSVIRDAKNNPKHFICQLYDITERKKAEEALRNSEKALVEAQEIVHIGSWEYDPATKKRRWSNEMFNIFGREQRLGEPSWPEFEKMIHSNDWPSLNNAMQSAINDGTSYNLEFRVNHPGGKISNLVTIGKAGRDSAGKIVKLYGTVQDVTEHKKLESQLFQAQKMETVGRLAGGIAHDFNNILTVIDGYCSMMLEDLKENHPEVSPPGLGLVSNIQTIRKASERAANLTRQLLAFSRKQPLQIKALNLNSLVTDISRMLHRVIGEDIKLIADLFPELSEVQADPGQIEQVIMNLVINARDAMPTGGQITIKTANAGFSPAQAQAMPEALPGNFVRLSIQDIGTGMSEETQKHLFEPFFTTKERDKGTGLGLSVIYGIVKQHNGWVNVQSETGKGSVFDIYLPVVATTSTNQPDSKIRIQAFKPKGNNQRILLIEDEQGIREVIAFGLRKSGYQVFEAATIAQARQIFEREKGNFDIIFSDVVLPDGNGVELAEKLSAINPKLRIIISSGYMDEQVQLKIIEDKGYQFIPKPYNITRLINTILKL